jgi:hypothetical protein
MSNIKEIHFTLSGGLGSSLFRPHGQLSDGLSKSFELKSVSWDFVIVRAI